MQMGKLRHCETQSIGFDKKLPPKQSLIVKT